MPWLAHMSDPWVDNPFVTYGALSGALNRSLERSLHRGLDARASPRRTRRGGVALHGRTTRESIQALVAESARDRRRSSSALLRLLELLSARAPSRPFVWLVDEVTEIRSLAYFPELGRIEEPFARAVLRVRAAPS